MGIRVYKRSETTLAIKFTEFNKESIAVIKKISGRKWLPDELIWTIPYTLTTVQQLLRISKITGLVLNYYYRMNAICFMLLILIKVFQ